MNKFKLNKKAFTLTELIAVIVILSILVTLSVVVFMNIRKSVLQKEYDNLVVYLETKGVEYANDTHITTISVEDLIKEGYVKPDDATDIYDPRDKKSLNCYLIKMEFKDGEYVAKFSENIGRNEDGTCKEYTKTSDFKICKVNGSDCEEIVDDEWFGNDVTLGIKYRDVILGDKDVKYSWSTNSGFTSKEKNVTTDVKLIGNVIYKCEVIYGEITGVATKNIKIDKEKPVISEIKVDTNWSPSKIIEVIANDGMGSGIGGYSFVKDNGVCKEFIKENSINVDEMGNYRVCVKDNVGNTSEISNVNVSKIDKNKPEIKVKKENPEIYTGENYNVLNEYFEVTYYDSGGTATCNIETTGSLSAGKYTLTCIATGGNGLKSEPASTTLTVKVFIPSIPNVETRYVNASGNIYNGSWTNKKIYFNLSPGASGDFVTSYQYKIGNGNWTTPSWLSMNGNKGSFTYTNEIENTIYIRACNSETCGESSVGKTIKIDTTAPTCKLSVTASGISIGTKSSDVTKFGVNKSTTASYTNTTQSLGKGKFYGHVYDRAGNTGVCSSEVVDATPLYNKTTSTCNESAVNNPIKYYTRTSRYCNRTQTDTEYSCSSGTYPKTGDYCYQYSSGSSYNGCSSGTYSNGNCVKYRQSSCSYGWTARVTSTAKYTCSKSPTSKKCVNLSHSYSQCVNNGCRWSQVSNTCLGGTYKYCSSGTLIGGSCVKTNQTSCASGWSKKVTTAAEYSCTKSADTCASGWSTCSWCTSSKCKKSTGYVTKTPVYSYSFDSARYAYNQTSCSSNSFSCDSSSNYGKTQVSCTFSRTEDNYTYSYSPVTSTSKNLSSCTSSTGYNTCSGTYTSSQSSMKNKTNVSCAVGSYSCATSYSKVGTSYCYK